MVAGQAALTARDVDTALARWRAALDLWRGEPLADVTRTAQLTADVAGLAERRLQVAEQWADVALDAGRANEVTTELTALVRVDPLREQLWAQLMLAHHQAGRPAAALAAYRDACRVLAAELGVPPGRTLQEAHQRIRTGDRPAVAGSEPMGSERDYRPPAPPPLQLPADLAAFAGRDGPLRQLDSLLSEPEAGAAAPMIVVAISGTAGVGKTTLALHWAHRVADRFPDGQLYVNLRGFDPSGTAVTPSEAIRGFLDGFAVPRDRVPADLVERAALYRSLLSGKRVLVVLDNARDAEHVRPLMPGSAGCLVVVTSRNRMSSLVATQGAAALPLDLLSPAEASALLAGRIGQRRVEGDSAAVHAIVARCARLPLALSIVGARVATHPGFSLAAIAAELSGGGSPLDQLDSTDPATDARRVFSWSYQALGPAAAELFRLHSLHPGPDVTVSAAAALIGASVPRARTALAELADAHLVGEHLPGRYGTHDLLRAYAGELCRAIDAESARHSASLRLLDHYLHTAYQGARVLNPRRSPIDLPEPTAGAVVDEVHDDVRAMSWFAAEYDVLLAAVDLAAGTGFDRHAWQLAWTLVTFTNRHGYWNDQAGTHQVAVRAAQRLGDKSGQAHSHRGLGRAYLQLGLDDDARTHLRSAIELFADVGDETGQANGHFDLAEMFERRGRYREALDNAQQLVELYRRRGGSTGEAAALNSVGWCHALLGEHDEALRYCQESLVMHQQLGDQHGEAGTWDSLGYIHRRLDDLPQAVSCYRHAVSAYRDLGDDWNQADSLAELADVLVAAGDPDAARSARGEALRLIRTLDHPEAEQLRVRLSESDTPVTG